MESPYATSYVWMIVTYLQFCIVSEIWRIIGPLIYVVEVPHLTHLNGMNILIQNCEIWSQETKKNPLSYGEKCFSIPWTILA